MDGSLSARWPADVPRLAPAAPEPGRSLLEEGPHAFALVNGPEQVQEEIPFHAHPVASGHLGRGSDRVFGGRERLTRSPCERPRVLHRLLEDRADVGSSFRFANRFAELEPDLQIDRVRGLAVDADHADAVVNLETNELAHGGGAYPVSTAAASASVTRSPSTSGVRETPNARAASGPSARDGSAKNDAVTASNGTPRSLVRISAAACPDAWVGSAPSPRSIPAKPSAVTTSGPSRPHVPASSAWASSIPAIPEATASTKTGARSVSPGPTTIGGSASAPSTAAVNHRPPSPYACVARTMACWSPEARPASSARPFARRNGWAVSGSAPGP